ncbi:MAG: transcriptional repressor NrdR [Phycisphaerae bacterium]|nr:transcriptional regulator NrdR [Phycisphaerae bacterium]NUQ44916.1 transcriptional repressor NrdR [Phycisphaerae bacterium]
MQCPFCREIDRDRVIDSRPTDSGRSIRRRRLCEACKRRFTTRERIDETVRMSVIKKDGTRVAFDRTKMLAGLQRACWKRPVSEDALNRLVDEVEELVFREFEREVPSSFIGRELAKRLAGLDKVSYVRFASVTENFQVVEDFVETARQIEERARHEAPGQQELFP